MKIISVVGVRPNFMKIAPFIRAIKEYNNEQGTSVTPSFQDTPSGGELKDDGVTNPENRVNREKNKDIALSF